MRIKKKHITKYLKMLTDTSAFQQVKEYHIKGDRPLRAFPTYLDSLWCKLRYRLSTKEYFYFSFYEKNRFARKQFLSSADGILAMSTKINAGDKKLFDYKINTYRAYKEFYRREAISVNLPSETEKLDDFANHYGSFILKPLNMSQGRGICFWDKDMKDAAQVLQRIKDSNKDEVMLEEIIQQDPEMKAFHPTSVNTIRYVVDYHKDGVDRLFAFIRIGVGDSKVDNTSAGGICAAIDLETGIIISEGLRRNGERFICHPDSGKQIIGTKIPKWNELNEMIEKLRPENSPVHLVGWDLALSEKGWCIVEGNWGPSFIGIQGCLDKGYKSVMKRVLKRMK